jgi:hypothetical protein
MATAIVLGLVTGAVLSLCLNWFELVWASAAALLYSGVSEIMNRNRLGATLPWTFTMLGALHAA